MANTAFTALFDDVLPHVPGCSQPIASDAIRKAAIEFCERSWAWIFNSPDIDVVNGQMAYPFTPPGNAVVSKVLQVWYDDEPLTPKTPDELNTLYPNWRTVTGTPIHYTQDDSRNLLLVPTPDADLTDGLKMRVALKPTIAAADIETVIYEEYREAIACGALAQLMMSPKKPYSDPGLAVVKLEYFESKIGSTRFKVQKGFARAPQRNVAHFF